MNDQVNVPNKFFLTDGEKISTVWAKLEDHLKDRLEKARLKNDNPKLSELDTAMIRGEIHELKYLISLGAERKILK